MGAQADLRQYIAILLHWAWLLLLATAVAGSIAYFLSSRQTPVYQATTRILIEEAPGAASQSNYNDILSSERRARTYAQLLTARPLLNAVVQKLALPMNAGDLAELVVVQSVRDTQLIRVQVQDQDPQRVATIANTLVTTFAEQRQSIESSRYAASKDSLRQQMGVLEQQIQQTESNLNAPVSGPANQAERDRQETLLAQYRESFGNLLRSFEEIRVSEAQSQTNIVQEEPAEAPGVQVAPRVLRNSVLAAIAGLLLAVGLVFLKETLDDTVKDPETLSKQVALPILGLIARSRQPDKAGPIVTTEPRSPIAEAYRALRTNIDFTSVDQPLRTLLVTSPSPGDGKSTTTVNLAAVLAQGGRKVTLVDADLRRPTLHQRLELTNRSGLSELFVQPEVQLDGAVRNTLIEDVSIVTAGVLPPNPAELLASQKMIEILNELQKETDVVVVDTPPVTAVTDAAVLAPRVDGVLLVVRVGQTRLSACTRAVEQLRRGGAHVLGMVVNDIPVGRVGYGYAYQGYYKYYQEPERSNTESGLSLRRLFRRKTKKAQEVSKQV